MRLKSFTTSIVLVAVLIILIGCDQKGNITPTQSVNSDTQEVLTQDSNVLGTHTPNATRVTSVVKPLDSTTTDSDPTKTPAKATSVVIDENVESSSTKIISNISNSLVNDWTLEAEMDSIGPEGVSPEAVILDDGTVRLYVTSMGIEIWESSDGLSFTRVSARTPPGSDPTVIRTSNGWRMYFTEHSNKGPEGGDSKIRTAISTDGIDWIVDSDTGIVQETNRRAW